MNVTFKEVLFGTDGYEQSVALRHEILRVPLGLEFSPEELAMDRNSHHLAGWMDKALVACAVLTPRNSAQVRMRQLAVRTELQRRGIGTALVEYAETFAASHGFSTIVLHARATAVEFYNRLGYEIAGAPLTVVTLPHLPMAKRLARTKLAPGT